MKKMTLICLALLFIAGYHSMASGADNTIENLHSAYKGETTASTKYAAFARQARQEGLIQIATMFEATSKAEQIHATNHQTVLEKMGQRVEPYKPEFKIKTTKENLEESIKGESYEIATMYPGFIAIATKEDATSALKSFRWAMDTEKKHLVMYQNAIKAINAKKTDSLPGVYWVCPKCGDTYDIAKPEASCAFCSTKSEKFIKFGK
jgi:rubrerythrin